MKKITTTILLCTILLITLNTDVNAELWVEDESIVSCEPRVLRKGETLTIKLGIGHGKELAILRESDKRWYFLVVKEPPKEMKSLMTPDEFKKTKTVTINTETVGFPWEVNPKNEVIFEQPGKYIIFVSEILESEVGGYKCPIEYLP